MVVQWRTCFCAPFAIQLTSESIYGTVVEKAEGGRTVYYHGDSNTVTFKVFRTFKNHGFAVANRLGGGSIKHQFRH